MVADQNMSVDTISIMMLNAIPNLIITLQLNYSKVYEITQYAFRKIDGTKFYYYQVWLKCTEKVVIFKSSKGIHGNSQKSNLNRIRCRKGHLNLTNSRFFGHIIIIRERRASFSGMNSVSH